MLEESDKPCDSVWSLSDLQHLSWHFRHHRGTQEAGNQVRGLTGPGPCSTTGPKEPEVGAFCMWCWDQMAQQASILWAPQKGPGEAGDSPGRLWGNWGLPQEGHEEAGDSPRKVMRKPERVGRRCWYPDDHSVLPPPNGTWVWHIPMSSSPGIGLWCRELPSSWTGDSPGEPARSLGSMFVYSCCRGNPGTDVRRKAQVSGLTLTLLPFSSLHSLRQATRNCTRHCAVFILLRAGHERLNSRKHSE